MLISDVRGPQFDPWPGQKVFSIFSPVTFGVQRGANLSDCSDHIRVENRFVACQTEIRGGILNGGGICGDVRYITHLYKLAFIATW